MSFAIYEVEAFEKGGFEKVRGNKSLQFNLKGKRVNLWKKCSFKGDEGASI